MRVTQELPCRYQEFPAYLLKLLNNLATEVERSRSCYEG